MVVEEEEEEEIVLMAPGAATSIVGVAAEASVVKRRGRKANGDGTGVRRRKTTKPALQTGDPSDKLPPKSGYSLFLVRALFLAEQ